MTPEAQEKLMNGGDYAAVAITGASFMEWIPAVTACFTAIWVILRVWEMKTTQKIVRFICKKFSKEKTPED